jgi:hypothetical protein
MSQPIRTSTTIVFLVLLVAGCGQSTPETKNGGELLDEVKRIEDTQIALVESENNLAIEKLERSITRMRLAIDAKAAEEVAVGLIVKEEVDSGAAPGSLSTSSQLRQRAGNARQFIDASQAYEQAKKEFLLRHPGVIERCRERLARERAAEASNELDAATGAGAGKK